MGEDGEGNRGFTISDRRRFSPDTGEPRGADDDRGDEAAATREAGGGGPGDAPATVPLPDTTVAEDAQQAATRRRGQAAEITLSTFIMSLSTQVLMHMGEIPNPVDNSVKRDMDSAKQIIDILGMLKEKTKGNLDRNEEALLDSILYDLRIRYVKLVKSGTAH